VRGALAAAGVAADTARSVCADNTDVKYKDRHKLVEAAERIAAQNQLASDRMSVKSIPKSLNEAFGGKTVLVTGGTGSIGREIVRQVLKYKPERVRIFSRNEYNQYVMRKELSEYDSKLRFLIGDVRDRERLMRACEDVEVIFHASALKHVEMCEYNPFEAVKTNVLGTQNVVDCALDYNMELLVGISTDKAVSPTNTMGATKLLAERVILSASQYMGDRRTRFCVIRFGNVLASRGSAIPLFIKQISQGGPVTLTHAGMRRFFMSIPQAVELSLKATLLAHGGEIFILKMPVLSIGDLAQALIKIYAPRFGFKPQQIAVEQIGLLPGEKLYEALMTPEEARHASEHADYYAVEALKPLGAAAVQELPAGYDSLDQPLLGVDDIVALLENHGLVEVFMEAIPHLPPV
jgi:UDP-N-acetylglucosamine 4,6-dehydratase/5-epimerase